jgi:hypothetical protein
MAAPGPASTFGRPVPTPSPRTNGHVDDDLDVPDFLK